MGLRENTGLPGQPENLKGKGNLVDLAVHGRTILMWVLKYGVWTAFILLRI
jgi:hypothetical protein